MKSIVLHDLKATSNPVNFNQSMSIAEVPQYLHDEVLFAINSSEPLKNTIERLSQNLGTNVNFFVRNNPKGLTILIEFEVPFTVGAKSQFLNNIADAIKVSKSTVEEAFLNEDYHTSSIILLKEDSASVNIQINLSETEMFPREFFCSSGFGLFFTKDSPEPGQITNALMHCAGKSMTFYDISKEVYTETHSQSPVTVEVRYIEGKPCFAISRSNC